MGQLSDSHAECVTVGRSGPVSICLPMLGRYAVPTSLQTSLTVLEFLERHFLLLNKGGLGLPIKLDLMF